jgi:hypothetical protein
MQRLYLTRRNLQTLINKLDRCKRDGADASACTLVKVDRTHPKYPCSDVIFVQALEDEEYYTDGRIPGKVLDAPIGLQDDPENQA